MFTTIWTFVRPALPYVAAGAVGVGLGVGGTLGVQAARRHLAAKAALENQTPTPAPAAANAA